MIMEDPNDSNWTDATDSQADDEIWMVDEEIMEAMEQESEDGECPSDKSQEDINVGDLESQFVKG